MNKQIFVLNGAPGAGKDTFAELLNEIIPTKHISSITPIKEAAKVLGWRGRKSILERNFLSKFKKFVNENTYYIGNYLDEEVKKFRENDIEQILLIDIREIEEIALVVDTYKAKAIYIDRGMSDEIKKNIIECGNPSDIDALDKSNYSYDYVIDNTVDDLDNFKKSVKKFTDSLRPPLAGKVIAVDFDNTIAKTRYPEVIAPIGETIEFLRKAKVNGAKIILWTCREGVTLDAAVEWCRANRVPIDYVNENDPDRIEMFGNDSRKIGADLYIDDKSFSLWHDRRNQQDLMKFLTGEEWKFDKNV